MTQLLPTRVRFRPGEPIGIEVRGLDRSATLTVWRLGEAAAAAPVSADGVIELPPLPVGGYGVELGAARTAFDVVADDGRAALRYGFVVDYRPDRDLAGFIDNARRLHLTDVQFYDWAYRHADLLGGGEAYADPLGQPIALAAVRSLIDACHRIGAGALGYAAVYGVGVDEWPEWRHDALLSASGQPHALGDFLFIVDPAAPDWSAHFTADLVAAAERVGFDGYHLDQYGYPKRARRADGREVDVAASFRATIERARAALPGAKLVFNNVNDFPTWVSAAAPQDAVYIEVWAPHLGLEHLAQTVTRARCAGRGKPVVIAAYQSVYDVAPAAAADLATQFTMATLFSHGATHLLCGEADRILVDPYYVRNHSVEPSTAEMLRRWHDFAVAHGELLFEPDIVEVTASFAGEHNDDIDVRYPAAPVGHLADPGAVWRRITQTPDGRHVVHLINLTGQRDTRWDAARERPGDTGPGTLRVRRTGAAPPRVRWASPDRGGADRLTDIELTADGDHVSGRLPPCETWQVVVIEASTH